MGTRWPLAGAALLALMATAPLRAECKLGIELALPISMDGLRPVTTAQVNGTDVPFLVDSGAFFSGITPGSAKQLALHLDSAPFNLRMRGVGGDFDVMIATVKKFGIAGHNLTNVEFLVGGSELGGDRIGVIGDNILSFADAEYDLAHGMVRLIKATNCVRTNFPFWAAEGQTTVEIPLTRSVARRTVAILSTATINGARIAVQFDSGASISVITRAAALRAGLDVKGPGVVDGGFVSGFGKHNVRTWIVPVAVFKIGDEEIQKTRLRVADSLVEGNDAPDMLLGADFFLSHHIYVANSLHKLYFTYNGGNVFNLKPVETAAAAPGAPDAAPAAGEPDTAEALARRGAASAGRRDFGPAIADLSRAITLAPDEPRYLSERAEAYLGNRQPFLAMTDLDAALKLRPGDVRALMIRAEVRVSGHDTAGARTDLAAAAAAAPREGDVRFAIGRMYEGLDALPDAIAQYDLWLAAHPIDAKAAAAYNQRCWARALLGTGLDLAEKDCAAAHRLDPANPSFLDSRGLVRLRRGDFARAVADYDAVLAKNPKVAWSLYGRGVAKLHLGDAAAGRADLTAAAAIAPKLASFAAAHGVVPPSEAPVSAPSAGSNQ